MKKSEILFGVLRIPVDFAMLVLAGLTSYGIRTGLLAYVRPVEFSLNLTYERYVLLVGLVSSGFILVFAIAGLYKLRSTTRFYDEILRIFLASSAAVTLLVFYIFLRQELFDSRFLILGPWVLGFVFVILGRLAIRLLQRFFVARLGYGTHRLVVVGNDEITASLQSTIQNSRQAGYSLVGIHSEINLAHLEDLMAHNSIDEIILANPNYSPGIVTALITLCNDHHIVFKFVPNMYHTLTANFEIDTIAGIPLIELRRTSLSGWGIVLKRFIDICGAFFGMIMLSPVLACVAFAIKWETAGPVFVRLKRVSGNRHFMMLKFRSMVENAEELKKYLTHLNERTDGPLFKIRDDPRVTGVGRIIRKFRLDELPQLWNVLRGDMSLVGPRPHQPDEIARYRQDQRRVLAIKAGVTGMAQVAGSSDLVFDEEVALDAYYIEKWSLWLDIKLIFMTFGKLLFDKAAV